MDQKIENPPWAMVILLMCAAILSFIDRQILSLLVEPIKSDLDINDFLFSLIGGPAFAVFYALAGLPLGYLADQVHRGRLIAAGVALWSAMTAISGFAGSYWHLFLARVGVGVGEASLGPAAHSLIADGFDAKRLPLAMSIYGTGVAIGAGVAFALGGQVLHFAEFIAAGPVGDWPLLGELAPWQLTFIVVGTPGLLVAALVWRYVKDTRPINLHASPAAMFSGLRPFWAARRSLILLYLSGVSLLGASGFAALLWLPSVFVRGFGWSAADAGLLIGLMLIVLAVGGVLASGAIAARLVARGRIDGPIIVVAGAAALSALLSVATALTSIAVMIAMLVPLMLVSNAYVGLGPAIVQAVTPQQLRGRVAALALMITSLLSMVIGPVSVGAVTTFLFKDPDMVGRSLAIMSMIFYAIGGLLVWLAGKHYRRLLEGSDEIQEKI